MERPLRILHLEDDKNDAELVIRTLKKEGLECAVTRVDTRDEFQGRIENENPDVVLADYAVPLFDGLSALALAREKRPGLPFIFVSGTIGEEKAIEALKLGAADYVLKDGLIRLAPVILRALETAKEHEKRKKAEQALRHRVDMEKMTASIATGLIGLSSEECDTGINAALQQLGEFSEADRVCLFMLERRATLCNTHEWCASGIMPLLEKSRELDIRGCVWAGKRLNGFEPVALFSLSELPADAAAEMNILELRSVKSLVMVPMVYGKRMIGLLTFESLMAEKTWSAEDLNMLEIASEILVNAMERRRADEKMNQRLGELERFRGATIQREFRIRELKERVRALEGAGGQKRENAEMTCSGGLMRDARKPVILIIDDDAGLRRTLSDILRFKGYDILAAAKGSEGLSLLEQRDVNLALIDLNLPDMSGLEVLRRLKDYCPLTESIILTGHAATDTAIEAVNCGAFSYVRKPCDVDQLLLNIRRAVEKQASDEALRLKLDEVERLNRLMVGRELKMEELRRRVEDPAARRDNGIQKEGA